MKLVLVVFLYMHTALAFADGFTDPITKIAKANKAKEVASKAFGNANYEEAIKQYNFILDSLGYNDPALELNRAHAYFQMKDTLRAFDHYRAASMAEQKPIQAKAFNQLGVLSEQQQQKKEALSYYKEALRADPSNTEARYNYELLKKKLQEEEKKKQEQKGQDKNQEQNQDQQKSDQKKGDKKEGEGKENSKGDKEEGDPSEGEKGDPNQEKQKQESKDKKEGEQQEGEQKEGEESEASQQEQDGKEGDKGEAKPSTSEKLKAMNVSQEKAKQILEALRNKEAQYLQQTRKRATKKKDSGKPDW